MFNRKMMNKLPQMHIKANKEMDKEVRQKHDAEKLKQKDYVDKKRRVKEKEVKVGDKILVQQNKSTTKTPWDPQPYEVLEVKGSKVKAQKGEIIRERAQNNI